MFSTESRFVTGPSNILFSVVYGALFSLEIFTGWGSEGVNVSKQYGVWDFNVHADVATPDCTQGLYECRKRVCAESSQKTIVGLWNQTHVSIAPVQCYTK